MAAQLEAAQAAQAAESKAASQAPPAPPAPIIDRSQAQQVRRAHLAPPVSVLTDLCSPRVASSVFVPRTPAFSRSSALSHSLFSPRVSTIKEMQLLRRELESSNSQLIATVLDNSVQAVEVAVLREESDELKDNLVIMENEMNREDQRAISLIEQAKDEMLQEWNERQDELLKEMEQNKKVLIESCDSTVKQMSNERAQAVEHCAEKEQIRKMETQARRVKAECNSLLQGLACCASVPSCADAFLSFPGLIGVCVFVQAISIWLTTWTLLMLTSSNNRR